MNNIKFYEKDIDEEDWNVISKKLQQTALNCVKKYGPNHARRGFKIYVQIVSDITYNNNGKLINTRVRDLHTDLGQTLINLEDLKSYCEEYIEMLQNFCENNNHGGIGSAGEFVSLDSFSITMSRPVAFL